MKIEPEHIKNKGTMGKFRADERTSLETSRISKMGNTNNICITNADFINCSDLLLLEGSSRPIIVETPGSANRKMVRKASRTTIHPPYSSAESPRVSIACDSNPARIAKNSEIIRIVESPIREIRVA